uniref:6-phosphogluconate dehydrogenase NADP-binding domain-containing protein n=1 Tax=Neolamprologus brichardi TaxID=32507 RepID=A0A3Q4GHE1_NEOBR
MAEADIALIGLAVMGQNLIMNMNDHGFVVCAYNRTVSKVHDFLQNEAKGSKVIGAESLEDMVTKLKKPRRIILLVKAGQAVDDFIDKLVTTLKPRSFHPHQLDRSWRKCLLFILQCLREIFTTPKNKRDGRPRTRGRYQQVKILNIPSFDFPPSRTQNLLQPTFYFSQRLVAVIFIKRWNNRLCAL